MSKYLTGKNDGALAPIDTPRSRWGPVRSIFDGQFPGIVGEIASELREEYKSLCRSPSKNTQTSAVPDSADGVALELMRTGPPSDVIQAAVANVLAVAAGPKLASKLMAKKEDEVTEESMSLDLEEGEIPEGICDCLLILCLVILNALM